MKKRLICLCLVLSVVAGLFVFTPAAAASDMKASDSCLNLIKEFEGFSGKPYLDTDGLYTIGYGTRCPADKVEYYFETPMTEEEATEELRREIVTYENAVNAFIDRHGATFTQQQFDAVVSLVFNVGPSWLTKGTTLINALLNGATGNELIQSFTIYSMSGGKRSLGHIRRRLAEANAYLNGQYSRVLPDNFCYVLYDGHGGELSGYNVQGYDANVTIIPQTTATRVGYTFKGWFTDAQAGRLVTILDATTANMTLYAHWEPNEGTIPDEPGENTAKVVTVVADAVNIRSGPGLGYAVVTKVGNGQQLTITEVKDSDGYTWGKFESGWIALEFTDYFDAPPAPTPCEHDYRILSQNPPTCTADGNCVYYCTLCDDGYGQTIPALGHDFVPASCTAAETCSRCGTTNAPALPHSYDRDGLCSGCGAKNPAFQGPTVTVSGTNVNLRAGAGLSYAKVGSVGVGVELVITETAQADGYLWGKSEQGWIALKYTNYGQITQSCRHYYVVCDRTEATCTMPGSVSYVCGLCKSGYTQTLAVIAHSFRDANCTQPQICEVCGTTSGNALGHRYGTDGVCVGCGAKDPDYQPQLTVQRTYATIINADALNVRKTPNGLVVGFLYRGDRVEILEQKVVNGYLWGRCEKGWIFIHSYAQVETVTEGVPNGQIATVTAWRVSVRANAGMATAIVGTLFEGDTVVILEKKTVNGTVWARIDRGWISMDYIK